MAIVYIAYACVRTYHSLVLEVVQYICEATFALTDGLPKRIQLRRNGVLCRAVYASSKPGQQLAQQTDRQRERERETQKEADRRPTGRQA